ncbi:MAG: aldehyde dehydrogenase family protein [Phycisphaerales bacterium]
MSTVLQRLGLHEHPRVVLGGGAEPGTVVSENPATGEPIAAVRLNDAACLETALADSVETFKRFRAVPAPVRGQIVREIAGTFRTHKADLGELVSLEVGKIRAEGEGEIQEIIDIADFAVGLSRQLPGSVVPSERVGHRMFEQWLPLGPVGVISAFNFPAAVWGWNAMIAAVCGDTTVWKPSLLAPLTAIACNTLAQEVATAHGFPGLFRLLIGTDDVIGERLIADRRLPLISATGSCRMGRRVGQVVASRLARSILELGGNNACIVHDDADLDLTVPAVVFAAVGTAGQRCTTTRRLIVHEKAVDRLVPRLVAAYRSIIDGGKIGDPLKVGTLVGPLINARAVEGFERAVKLAREQGGEVLVGGKRAAATAKGHFVEPTIIRAPRQGLPIALEETFAPILYIFTYRTIDEAVAIQNSVDQGLSSAVFTEGLRTSERFLAVDGSGSDCGLAYVNMGTSGAEIGGAFGGEKDTGGGRESGSDAWKQYMRRQGVVVNSTGKVELAQGIRFE